MTENPLLDLARRVGNLHPDWQRPERFYEARSEIAAELRRLAGQQSPTVIHKYSHKYTSLTHSDVK
ncbi:hypothetical protein [Acidiphilium sp.]|uniref:hypothetical protein n=1 Tax=Acidiphilium sp. TaxID=527 RepID=UPI002586997D|nr:hypothetical protein [Acidiphilium sp.]